MIKPKIYWEIPEALKNSYDDVLSAYFDSIALGSETIWRFGHRVTEPGSYIAERSENGSYHDNFHGAYRKLRSIRRGFVFTFPPGNDDIRLLFEELEKWQGFSAHEPCYRLLRIWDGVLCDPEDRATRTTLRIGTITTEISEGSLWDGQTKCLPADNGPVTFEDVPNFPISAWNPGFKIRFEPKDKQIIT